MSIDDSVGRDPRITLLASLLGWSRRETLGCLVQDVWPVAYDQESHLLSERVIDTAANHVGFAAAMLESELARRHQSGKMYVCGAKQRIKYLTDKKESGRAGGLKRAENLVNHPKQNSSTPGSTPQASRNPPDPVLVPVPDPAIPNQKEIAVRVLAHLGSKNGLAYRGSKNHLDLICARLTSGLSESDLIAVVDRQAREWPRGSEMHKYLRPETLFGAKTIDKYIDAAIAERDRRKPTPTAPAADDMPPLTLLELGRKP